GRKSVYPAVRRQQPRRRNLAAAETPKGAAVVRALRQSETMSASTLTVILRLHQHRGWVNSNLLTAASQLSDEQLRRSFEIGQGSVWKSLLHMYAAEYVWLGALMGEENPLLPGDLPGRLPGNQLGDVTIKTLADLQRDWNTLQGKWGKYLG